VCIFVNNLLLFFADFVLGIRKKVMVWKRCAWTQKLAVEHVIGQYFDITVISSVK